MAEFSYAQWKCPEAEEVSGVKASSFRVVHGFLKREKPRFRPAIFLGYHCEEHSLGMEGHVPAFDPYLGDFSDTIDTLYPQKEFSNLMS